VNATHQLVVLAEDVNLLGDIQSSQYTKILLRNKKKLESRKRLQNLKQINTRSCKAPWIRNKQNRSINQKKNGLTKLEEINTESLNK
jgi:hypothetical protein